MNTQITHTRTLASAALVVAIAAVFLTASNSTHARADEVVADSAQHGLLVAAGTAPAAPTSNSPRAVASLPRGIVVSGHLGAPVSLFAEGRNPIRRSRPGSAPATFTGLQAGTAYTVIVGGASLGQVIAIDRPARVTRLLVHASGSSGTVNITWKYAASRATGGSAVTFILTATSPTAPAVTARVTRVRSATLSGLDPSALYTFAVTPANSAGKGRTITAGMSRTLAQLAGTPTPVVPVPPAPSPTPTATPTATAAPAPPAPIATPAPAAPAPAPAPPAAPTTVTIYVCPDGYPETGGLCQKTTPYTYDIKAYTSHQEPVYGYGQIDWSYVWGYCSGAGTSGNWPNGDPYCRTAVYGDGAIVGYQSVRDATPAGYTDTGTNWQKKDPAPTGYLDNGTQWVTTVPKVARVVPA